jgi:hypothetical protein
VKLPGRRPQRRRIKLGSWTCPSGNSVDVFAEKRGGIEHWSFAWDSPPPLSPADDHHYQTVILPAVHVRYAEYQEKPVGRALVVRAEGPRG